jgi:hypothetical protein
MRNCIFEIILYLKNIFNYFASLLRDLSLGECRRKYYTGCPRRKGPNFWRVFLRSNYTDITQNTYIQSSMVTEILAREV